MLAGACGQKMGMEGWPSALMRGRAKEPHEGGGGPMPAKMLLVAPALKGLVAGDGGGGGAAAATSAAGAADAAPAVVGLAVVVAGTAAAAVFLVATFAAPLEAVESPPCSPDPSMTLKPETVRCAKIVMGHGGSC